MTSEHTELLKDGPTEKSEATQRFSELLRALETEHLSQKQELGAQVEQLQELLRLQSEGFDSEAANVTGADVVPTERSYLCKEDAKLDAPPQSLEEQNQQKPPPSLDEEVLASNLRNSQDTYLPLCSSAGSLPRGFSPRHASQSQSCSSMEYHLKKNSALKTAFRSRDVWRQVATHGHRKDIWKELTVGQTGTFTGSASRRFSVIDRLRRHSSLSSLVPDLQAFRMLQRMPQLRPGVISPNGSYRMCWDMLGLIFILYDIIAIPLQVFELETSMFTTVMDWITLIYWTLDVYHGFTTGHYSEGQIVRNLREIAKRYITTWFLLDIIVIVPDWITLTGSDAQFMSNVAIGRAMRLGKTLRVLRLVRIVKLKHLVDSVLEWVDSEYAFTVINLCKLMCFILLLNHMIACLWFWVGDLSSMDGGLNWLEEFQKGIDDIPTLYFASLHWSLTQFTPASMNVCAQNIYERIFSIAVLFFAMMAFSSVVGSVTSSMTQLGNLKSGQMKEHWVLRRYLRQNFISKELQYRIEKFLDYRSVQDQATVQPASVVALGKLSEPLKNELTFAIYLNWLKGHFLFKYISSEMPFFMHRLSRAALLVKSLAAGDSVFSTGEESTHMFFIQKGLLLDYSHMNNRELDRVLSAREWLSEAALWVPWRHLGDCKALAMGELLTVSSSAFAKETSCKITHQEFCEHYANLFINVLNSMPSDRLSDVMGLREDDKDIPRKITDEASALVADDLEDEIDNADSTGGEIRSSASTGDRSTPS